MTDHTLGHQTGEWLIKVQIAGFTKRPGEKAGIEKVQDGVFDPADILIDRHPVGGRLTAEPFGMPRVGIAKEIPRTFKEGVKRVLLANGRAAACRAAGMFPGRMVRQRIAGGVEFDILGKLDRQVGFRHRHHAAGFTMNDGDRASPITLARHAPVAKPVGNLAIAGVTRFQRIDGGAFAVLDAQPVPCLGIEQLSGPDIGRVGDCETVGVGIIRQHHRDYRQVIGIGKIKVPLVMRRTSEDGAGAIFHQHEIGNIDWQPARLDQWVPHGKAGVETLFLGGLDSRLGRAELGAFGDKGGSGAIALADRHRQWMVGRDGQERGPVQGIRPCGEDIDAVCCVRPGCGQVEAHPRTFRPANPVLLHQPHAVGPAIQPLDRAEKFIGIFGDLQEPL